MLDFIAFMPFAFILHDDFLSNSFGSNVYLIKLIRLPRGLTTFDAEEWFKFCNDCFQKRNIRKAQIDPSFGEDTSQDLNNFEFLLKLKYALKTIYLVLIMLSISFFIGMMWHKFVDMQLEIYSIIYKDSTDDLDKAKEESFGAYFDPG